MKKILVTLAAILIFASTLTFHLSPFTFHLNCAATASDEISLPIVMYHSVLKSRKSKYVITPAQLETDFQAYADMGYTPVFLREVIDYVEGRGALPPKPMVITFDDGHYNNLSYALPVAQKFNFKFVVNVVTSFSSHSTESGDDSNPNYSYLTFAQMKELTDSGLVEIGNHTHAMHKLKPRYGVGRKSGESDETYCTALRADLEKSQQLITSAGVVAPTTFAYPFGKYTPECRTVLKDLGFKALLTCNEGISQIRQGEPETLLTLKRYNRSGNTSTASFTKKVFGEIALP